MAGVRAIIDKSEQRMYVYVNEKLTHVWLASTGAKSAYTPTGTFHPQSFDATHVSSIYGDPMPYSVFYKGDRAVHGTVDPEKIPLLGVRGSSMGCTHLSVEDAKTFYQLASKYKPRNVTIKIQE